jgi:hypothetical protein
MTSTTTASATPTAEIRMGHGLTAPDRPVRTDDKDVLMPSRPWRRIGLVGAAALSPLALALQYGLNSAGLPRQDAEVYLAAVAAAPGRVLASTVAYAVGMATMVGVGALAAIVLRRQAPVASAASAALLTLGAVGGGAFVGLRLAALAFVEDGSVVPGGIAAFVRLQDAIINPVGLLLVCAIVGTMVMAFAMFRARRDIGWWPAAVTVVGFVLASGEFPTAVSVLGALVQGAALLPLARLAIAAAR